MYSTRFLYAIAAGVILFCSMFGCSSVDSVHPLGDVPTAEVLKKINIEGTWLMDDQAIQIKQLEAGKLKIAGMEWKEDHFEVNELDGQLRVDDELHYLNLIIKDEKTGKQSFAFLRLLKVDDEYLVFCAADAHEFEKAIAAGDLEGTVKQEHRTINVTLTSTTEQINAYVTPERANTLFSVDEPGVLRRLRQPEKK